MPKRKKNILGHSLGTMMYLLKFNYWNKSLQKQVFCHASLSATSVCRSITLVQTEIFEQILHFVAIKFFRGWILLTSGILWLFLQHQQKGEIKNLLDGLPWKLVNTFMSPSSLGTRPIGRAHAIWQMGLASLPFGQISLVLSCVWPIKTLNVIWRGFDKMTISGVLFVQMWNVTCHADLNSPSTGSSETRQPTHKTEKKLSN